MGFSPISNIGHLPVLPPPKSAANSKTYCMIYIRSNMGDAFKHLYLTNNKTEVYEVL